MKRKLPPGPRSFLSLREVNAFRGDPLAFLSDMHEQYGDFVQFRMGPYHTFLFFHPDQVRELLVQKQKSFHKMAIQKRVLSQWDGNGLVLSEGDFWLRQRRLVQPAFSPRRFARYAQDFVGCTLAMVAAWEQQWRDESFEIEIHSAMTDLTLDIIGRTFFGVELATQASELRQVVSDLSEIAVKEMGQILPRPMWLPLPSVRRKKELTSYLDRTIRGFIKAWRESGEDRGDLLSMLLMAVDEEGNGQGMTDEQARDEAMVLFLAGHDTTAAALGWSFYLLAVHADTQQRARHEVRRVVGERPATFEDVAQLHYITMVIKESMRLYPPAALLFGREAIENVEIGGYPLRKGEFAYVAPWVVQRDPRWFAEPEKFEPERFLPEREKQLPQFAYFPFGGGPRVCIGNTFSMTEMTLIVATLLQRYELSLVPNQNDVRPIVHMSLRPAKDTRLKFEPIGARALA